MNRIYSSPNLNKNFSHKTESERQKSVSSFPEIVINENPHPSSPMKKRQWKDLLNQEVNDLFQVLDHNRRRRPLEIFNDHAISLEIQKISLRSLRRSKMMANLTMNGNEGRSSFIEPSQFVVRKSMMASTVQSSNILPYESKISIIPKQSSQHEGQTQGSYEQELLALREEERRYLLEVFQKKMQSKGASGSK